MSKPVILVDGSSYLFRAFYALPNLTTAKGEPTGAMLGVMNMLRRLIKDYQPEHIVVVFDAKGKNFRHELYPDYKANRAAMPDDLRPQIAPLHKLIQALGLPLVSIEGVEADDVIGTLSQQLLSQGHSVLISTGDKDMAQLIHERLNIVDTMKNHTIDRDYVLKKYGVAPEQIIDYLALMGDSSDNIPGIPKVGPKTAAKWLTQYGDLDNLIAHADDIGGKVGESLRAHLDQLPLSRQLATICCDVDVNLPLSAMQFQAADHETLAPMLVQYEFKAWLKDIQGDGEAEQPKGQYECILTAKQWQLWQDKIRQAGLMAFDTETDSLDALQANLVGVSFAVKAGEAAYLPLGHRYLGVPEQLPFDKTLAELKALLEDTSIAKVGQNLKYDQKVLQQYGIEIASIQFDTMLASYVIDAAGTRHNMDALAKKYLGHETIHYEDVAGKGAKQITFDQVNLEVATPYAAEDADITLQLYQTLKPLLLEVPALQALFENLEMPTSQVIRKIESYGVLLDSDFLSRQSQSLATKIAELEQEAYSEAGMPFNLGSPKQLQEILYQQLQLPVVKKTPKGQPSTAEEVLQTLAEDYRLPQLILEYRHLSKLKSTYTDKLPKMVNPKTGRVHTHYHQAVTSTGRLSSSDPNLQNIPVRTAVGRQIRQAFIAPEGRCIVAADYSQIELRIMAHLSQDKGLLTAFANNEDIHRATAAEVFGVAKDAVTTEQRRRAKAINFGLIYGMSAFGLAKQLGIGRNEAQQYVDIYFERYPGVKHYMESTKEKARGCGYVETLLGRRLYLPEINASNGMRRQAAERAAINAPMQGTAADIIKQAMLNVDHWLKNTGASAAMIMQVHDELVFEVLETERESVVDGIRQAMESSAQLDVPLLVDVGVGLNWDEAH